MVKRQDNQCFDLFQALNCTIRVPFSTSLSGSGGKLNEIQIQHSASCDSPCRSVKDDLESIGNLDKDKMMAHILDCLSALVRVDELQDDGSEKSLIAQSKKKVFRKAIDLIMESSTKTNRKPDLERILQSFPDSTKLQDDRKWLSLHWAVLEDANMDEDDIENIYSSDPMALTRHHLKNLNENFCQGYTPTHLISFQKNPRMPVVRFLDIHSPRAFLFPSRGLTDKRCRYPVQLASAFSESIDFLQFLLQIHNGASKIGLGTYSTPLCELIKRDNYDFASFPTILQCLLAIDSAADVVNEAMRGLIQKLGGKKDKSGTLLSIFEILLKANNEAAFVLDVQGRLVLHYASKYLKDVPCATTIIAALLLVNKEGARVVDNDECYAITTAAQYSTVAVVKLLQEAHPDATIVDQECPKRNVIHNGIYNEIDKDMIGYLCSSFPEALQGFSQDRKMPLHELCYQNVGNRFRSLKTMCTTDPLIAKKGCGAGSNRLGIPLHLLIIGEAKAELKSTTSDAADCFRHLLKQYPESASIRDVDGNTSYTLAVLLHMKPYFIRLLLRADITIDPAVLRGLNYKERRGGMFLAFSAVSSNKRPSLLALIRKANLSVLEIVFSYL